MEAAVTPEPWQTLPAATIEVLERMKIVALSTGVRLANDVLEGLGGAQALTVHEYATTGGITVSLPGGVFVNAPFDEEFSRATPLQLVRGVRGLEMALGADRVPVLEVLPLPGYLDITDGAGRPVTDTVMSHADRVRVSPIVGCAFNCKFCDLGTLRYERRPVDQLLASIDVAMKDESLPARHLLISGGSAAAPGEHQDYFEQVCVEIIRHVRRVRPDFGVDIMMSPRESGPEFVETMVEAGVEGFSLNIEVFSADAALKYLPLKHKASRAHLERTIRRAVELLGSNSGRVRSLIIPGLEEPEQTLEGVDWLASLGCDPVLSPFRPAGGTPLADAQPVSAPVLTEVLAEARRRVIRHGVALGPRCVPCQHNTLTFPWDVNGGAG